MLMLSITKANTAMPTSQVGPCGKLTVIGLHFTAFSQCIDGFIGNAAPAISSSSSAAQADTVAPPHEDGSAGIATTRGYGEEREQDVLIHGSTFSASHSPSAITARKLRTCIP